jgi:hypothetical protein
VSRVVEISIEFAAKEAASRQLMATERQAMWELHEKAATKKDTKEAA